MLDAPTTIFEVAERLTGTVARFWRGIGDLAMPLSVATRARNVRTDVGPDGQLDLFDGLPDRTLPLADAREAGDVRPALIVLASCLGVFGTPSTSTTAHAVCFGRRGDDWLRRLETQQKSDSTLVGYRVAIDDLLDWSETNERDILTETAIVDYLHS